MSTQQYLALSRPAADEGLPDDTGLQEVSRALGGIALGYLLALFNVVGAVALVWYVFWQLAAVTTGANPQKLAAAGDALTVLYIGCGLLILSGLTSAWLILRSKWRCLMFAPERYGAKWWMFASMLCIVAGPVLGFWSGFVSGYEQAKQAQRDRSAGAFVSSGADRYTQGLGARDASGYASLASNVIGPLGGVFFILFLRALALHLGDTARARVTEAYLVFSGLVLAGSLVVAFNPLLL